MNLESREMKFSNKIPEEIKTALISYLSGNITREEFGSLEKWIQESSENKKLFDQVNELWQVSTVLNQSNSFNTQRAWDDIATQLNKATPLRSKRILNSTLIRIAAIFILAFVLGSAGFYFFNKDKLHFKSQVVEYVAPLGSRSYLLMPDGTKVWLNSGTRIKYQNSYGFDNRSLDLEGEAYFEVAKNKKLPFVVLTPGIKVTALGTEFNVKAYAEENTIETTLIEGSVKLEGTDINLNKPLVLYPNEKAVFTKSTKSIALTRTQQNQNVKNDVSVLKPKIEVFKAVDPLPITSWKDKRWVISNQKLSDLTVKLERRYDVNFIFENEKVKDYTFGGTLEDETLAQVLEVISFTAPIKYVIDNKTVYIQEDSDKLEYFKNVLMR